MRIIGELINNSFARARSAWTERNLEGYQHLARLQSEKGAEYINVNIDGTQRISVRPEEMLAFLPELVPALQEATRVPLSFDNPSIDYQRVALQHFDRSLGQPIVNSLAASRHDLDGMIELVAEYDTKVIVMASERFLPGGGSAQCLNAEDAFVAVQQFVEMLADRAGRTLDDIIVDPGLAPVGADTYGLVNIGLDTMRLISADPSLRGIHFSVGLSNFAWGTPKDVRSQLECAYLTLGAEVGLDFALANPEKSPRPLPSDDPVVAGLRNALEQGRVQDGESQEDAGYRQAEAIMEICADYV